MSNLITSRHPGYAVRLLDRRTQRPDVVPSARGRSVRHPVRECSCRASPSVEFTMRGLLSDRQQTAILQLLQPKRPAVRVDGPAVENVRTCETCDDRKASLSPPTIRRCLIVALAKDAEHAPLPCPHAASIVCAGEESAPYALQIDSNKRASGAVYPHVKQQCVYNRPS